MWQDINVGGNGDGMGSSLLILLLLVILFVRTLSLFDGPGLLHGLSTHELRQYVFVRSMQSRNQLVTILYPDRIDWHPPSTQRAD